MSLPKPNRDFVWVQEPWGPALHCVPLARHAAHLFTSRSLALGGGPEEAAAAWTEVAGALDLGTDRLVRLRQVHGARVVEARGAAAPAAPEGWPEGDVLIGREPATGLAVRVADCVPLLMADARSGAVAAVHAGWRGTAAGAPLAAVAALERTYGVRPADLVAAAGPSIGPCCYVVGPELVAQFANHPEAPGWFRREGGLRLDLWRATRDQLLGAGLLAENLHFSMLCTSCHADVLCSYRKEGDRAGRMAGAIRAGRPDEGFTP